MAGFDLLITWATSGFLKAITSGYSQGSSCHLGSPHSRQLPVFHYMNFPVSESTSSIGRYCFCTHGHQQETQKQLGQRKTAKQQSLLSSDVWEGISIQLAKEKRPDLPIWLYRNLESNLTPWDLLLGLATLWCSQRQKMEGNDSVLSVMKSSQDGMSAWFGYKSPTEGTSEAEGWHYWQGYCWSSKRNLKYFSKHITEACMKAKEKTIKKSHCIAHRGLITKWLIRYPCKTTQKIITFKASQSTSLRRKHRQMHRTDGRSKSQSDEQHSG